MNTPDTISVEEFRKLRKRRKGRDWEGAFLRAWKEIHHELPPVEQYVFCPPRKWAFDFSWQLKKVAVEIEGGTWQTCRHTTAEGYREDCRKYRAAVILGWRVLRYVGSGHAPDCGLAWILEGA